MLLVEVHNDLAVRVCLEVVLALQALAELLVVVDLTVDGKDDLVILGGEGLGTGV
jgi:hypothetical protein